MVTNQEKPIKVLPTVLRNHNIFIGLLVLAFLFFGFVGIVNHEMWLDELQAWLIARDSSSVIDLYKNLRYEGHPGLWHISLYLISRFTHDPIFMQFFHLIIATSSVYIFAKFAPFTKLQKIVFSFGYFPFYEYNIISRNYALGILLIFCFCALFKTRTRCYFFLACILFLLANTNIYGLITTIALVLTLIVECILYKNVKFINLEKWDIIISLIVVSLGIILSLFQLIPPSDASFAAGWTTNFQIGRAAKVLQRIGKSYLPIPDFFTYKFWGTSIFTNGKIAKGIGAILSVGLLTFSLMLFARKPVVFFLYLSETFTMLFFMYFKYIGEVRHYGHLFISFITCLWISSYYNNSDRLIHSCQRFFPSFTRAARTTKNLFFIYRSQIIMAILYTHLAAGIFAFTMDLHKPFSDTKEVSNFIKQQGMEDRVIIGDIYFVDYVGPPLSAYLKRKVYYLGSQRSDLGSFIVWNNKRKSKLSRRQEVYNFFESLDELVSLKNTDVLLVLNDKLESCRVEKEDGTIEGWQVKFEKYCFEFKNLLFSKVSEFKKSIILDEKSGFYLYLIRHKLTN